MKGAWTFCSSWPRCACGGGIVRKEINGGLNTLNHCTECGEETID